jgi:hypothetical protein
MLYNSLSENKKQSGVADASFHPAALAYTDYYAD